MMSQRTKSILAEAEKRLRKENASKGEAYQKAVLETNRISVLLAKSRRIDFRKAIIYLTQKNLSDILNT